ncbi:beta-glucoside-specific PTS transporter subunit IIABC [uncultured Clostridium sp.]|uniref:beta-glucoside-specific PTS transporter subunit IIABC n=1 Tax=uncultured Clostridium sp. TaxID=59620 RepID=UPI0025E681CE|nr:beta-glucoside-specific PTS transporter subunit IIABC [uncultured Clostridium sp.]MDU4882403.1 beta-glucoside-specific PTS transporter subunit IIABC [Clostridium celatum]MDU7075891.1 beta-glucoside-specific PTS transporter subunit IIABC [Clostridium celatum]
MANSVRDYEKLAVDIINAVGGKKNIIKASRCATRLRLVLKETTNEAKENVSALTGVITVVENGGQFQVVIGTHVGKVFDKVASELNLDSSVIEEDAPKASVLNRIIATMSAVFAPFIYILAAAGILQGCLILINMVSPSFSSTGTYEVLSFMSWAPFTFLPIFIAITASKHFKCNMFIAVACCAALVSPTWAEIAARIADGESIRFLGISLAETTYTSSVLPPLFLVWILSYVERFVDKKLPEVIKALFTPFICMVVMVPLTILVIGPLSDSLATAIANGYNYLYNLAPAVAAAVIGGLWQIVVIFGVHWGVTPMCLANYDLYGMDTFQAFQTMAVIAQAGAVFGVFIKARNKQTKNIALSAGVTGIFGITEPAIYGVNLKFKKPFICGCIAGAVGAVVGSFFNIAYYAYAGLPGMLTVVNAITPDNSKSIIGMLLGAAISFVGAIILVQIIGIGEKEDKSVKVKEGQPVLNTEVKEIKSPISGKVIELEKVNDPVFSSGAMGKGVAIEPLDNKVYAPFNGTIEFIADTKHAIGLLSEEGVEVLIHVGMDTVKMNGRGFNVKTSVNSKVKAGDLLLEFDRNIIEKEGYSLITPVVITNADNYEDKALCINEEVKNGMSIINLKELSIKIQ